MMSTLAAKAVEVAARSPEGRRRRPERQELMDTNNPRAAQAGADYRTPDHIKAALTPWCLGPLGGVGWDLDRTCRVARELGLSAVEVVPPEDFPVLAKHGLTCALTGSHSYVRGMNNPLHRDACLAALRKSIDASAAAGFPNVVTFTGFADTTKEEDGTPAAGGSVVEYEEGIRNCVEGYKQIVAYAESRKVTLCLEALNSRDGSPMRGHPGYQGAHLDYVLEVIRRVGSPALKLLLDVYHIQIMDGDLIRRIREIGGEAIAHVQVAGVPGRGELDADQEVNWLAVMRALDRAGYRGWVGLEFIPQREPVASLIQALQALGMRSPVR